MPNRVVTVNQLGEIDLELVPVTWRVGALHLAQLALEAGIHDPLGIERRHFTDIAVVLVVDRREEDRKRVAVLEAHAAAMADLEDALELFAERAFVPVLVFTGVVAQPIGGLVRDSSVRFFAHSG